MASLYKRNGKGNWRISYFDHQGRRREKSAKTTDHAAAQRIANDLEAKTALRRDGVVDAKQESYAEQGRKPLDEHLADFATDLLSRGNTPKYVERTWTLAHRVIERAGAERINNLTPAAIQRTVASIRDEGRSLTTCNHALRAIKSFSRWLHRERRTREDALQTLQQYNAHEDTRHVHRDLSDEELALLIETTASRDIPQGMTGEDRAMLYLTAAATGYRRGELLSLTPASFDLSAEPSRVLCEAATPRRDARTPSPSAGTQLSG